MRTLAELIQSVPRAKAVRPGVMVVPWVVCVLLALAIHYGIGIGVSTGVFNDYWANVVRRIGVFIIAAVSLNIVNGFTGQFSMGHAGFMAVGGYVAAAVTYYGSLYFHGSVGDEAFAIRGLLFMLTGIGLGGIVAAGLGYLVGLPSLRLRGDYLAIVTLGFGEIIRVMLELTGKQVYDAQEFHDAPIKTLLTFPFNGPAGFERIPNYASLFWVYLFVAITYVIAYRVKNSSSGRAFLSIREDEIAARAMGVDLTKYKVRAFVLAAFFGAIAGGLYAHTGVNPSPTDAGFQRSFEIIIFVVLGGLGSISGAALAAGLLTLLTEILRGPQSVYDSWLVWIVVAAVCLGAAGVLRQLRNRGWRVLLFAGCVPLVLLGFAFAAVKIKLWSDGRIDLADYRMILYALMLILVMLLRPNGLMGVHEIWDFFGKPKPKEVKA